jgi:uncharacterized protein YjaZ
MGMLHLAYNGFKAFLEGPLTWENYKQKVIDSYGDALWNFHLFCAVVMNKRLADIKEMITSLAPSQYLEVLEETNDEKLEAVYESVASKSEAVIQPLSDVDVYFVLTPLPKFCCSIPANGKLNAVISVRYNMEHMHLILAHEYAHCIFAPYMAGYKQIAEFTERSSEQKFRQFMAKLYFERPLKFQIVNEGLATYFPRLLFPQLAIHDLLFMMPPDAVTWCVEHERMIKATMGEDLELGGMESSGRYLLDGPMANPPDEFPAKTGYYAGYRVIKSCLKNMALEELLSLDVDGIIRESKYFK